MAMTPIRLRLPLCQGTPSHWGTGDWGYRSNACLGNDFELQGLLYASGLRLGNKHAGSDRKTAHPSYVLFSFLGNSKSLMVLGKKRLALEWEASSFFRPGHRLDHLLRYKQRDSTLRLSWFHVIV
jgi:hypothetical protein